jgi:hypothetical protein
MTITVSDLTLGARQVTAQTRKEYESARRVAHCLNDEYGKLPEGSPYRDYYLGHCILLAESLVDSPASAEEEA